MKRLASVLFSAGCLLLLPGCGEDSHGPAPPRHESDHDLHATGLTLELDNGHKWQVDEHTRRSAAEMAGLIGDAAPVNSVDDARTLATAFDEELQNLIQGCTMKGPAHDQLHLFLAALFPRVEELSVKTDLEELRETQLEIRSLFDAYERYFQ